MNVIDCSKCIHCEVCGDRYANDECPGECSNFLEYNPTVETKRQQGEWIDYDNTFYKCPDCGYLLEKCCPQCQNKVILPKGGAE